jgi:hypothetical protein
MKQLWFHVKEGLETRLMLDHASRNAQALLLATLKHCLKQCSSMHTACGVRVVRATYGEPEQIRHGCGRRSLGRSPV